MCLCNKGFARNENGECVPDGECIIVRLNSGNFGIFDPSELMLKSHSSVCRAFQDIQIDTKIVIIPWDFQLLNKFLNFCVGDCVGGHPGWPMTAGRRPGIHGPK